MMLLFIFTMLYVNSALQYALKIKGYVLNITIICYEYYKLTITSTHSLHVHCLYR